MKRTLLIISLTSLVLLLLGALSFGSCGRPDGGKNRGGGCSTDTTTIDKTTNNPIVDKSTKYNILIENSGSMKGYFSGNSSSELETIIRDYYDRLTSEDVIEGDTVTLNFINVKKENSNLDIVNYLKSVKTKCTEKYTKIDDILKMSMDNAAKENVNIVISDYCFESPDGNLETAQSGITKLFTNQLKDNDNLSVAILKYDVAFNGTYFPGSIPCNQSLPVYLWIFGNADKVKKVLALHVKKAPQQVMLLQKPQDLDFVLSSRNARAIKEKDIIVKNLNKDKRDTYYTFDVKVDLSKVILNESELKNKSNYEILSTSSSDYNIESISNSGDEYTYRISTLKPAPGELKISFMLNEPGWVESSNFEGVGVPPKGKTHGIKYLIGGVFDAFHNLANNYFTISINLK